MNQVRQLGRVSAMACGVLASLAAQQQQPTFRSVTDVVTVPVSVRVGNKPVTGLTAADFVIVDRGVEQTIVRVDSESLPIDVTLIVDTSGSTEQVIDDLRDDAKRIAAILRPQDRLQLLTIDTYAQEMVPLQAVTPAINFDQLKSSGLSSVHDALATAMLVRGDPERRRLIVAMTDGIDSISALGSESIASIARVTDAVVEIFLIDTATAMIAQMNMLCAIGNVCEREARYWVPYQDRDPGPLRRAAVSTGGELQFQGAFRDRSPVGMFRQTFEEFRRSYLLRYSPRGVAREGWHPIEIRLRPGAAPEDAAVRAKPGYFIGLLSADPASDLGAPSPANLLGSNLSALISAYSRDDFDGVARRLETMPDLTLLLSRFRYGGNPWPNLPRREAVFALELADAGLYARQLGARAQAADLLTWYRRLVRHPLEPDNFERFWYWAEIAMLEGILEPDVPAAAVENALRRFPGEPRFLLARAFVLDQRWPHGTAQFPNEGGPFQLPDATRTAAIIRAYEAAAIPLDTRFEARLRLGFFFYRLGRYKEAADALQIANPPEKELAYLHALFLGKVLEALERADEAERQFQLALTVWPDAQSPRIALMTLAARRGDRTAAQAMADAVEAQSPASSDPFWRYWQGDSRFYPTIRQRLRQAIQ